MIRDCLKKEQQEQKLAHKSPCIDSSTTNNNNDPAICLPSSIASSSSPALTPFLNVSHMVRQSSDTTQNRIGNSRKLSRSTAFDDEQPSNNSNNSNVDQRPATSCLNSNEMPFCSPHALRKPTQHTNVIQTSIVDASDGSADYYIQLNQYRLIEEIAQGSYGIVKLAYNEQDRNLYALKVLDKLKLVKNFACFRPPPIRKKSPNPQRNDQQQQHEQLAVHRNPLQLVQREIAILKKLSHPNVVKLVEVLDDPQDNFLYMVFEYVERRSLMDLPTNPLTEHIAWKYFRDTLKGLEYLHYQKIIHRDLKPSNLLLSDADLVKIADFGVSCEFEGIDAFLTGTAGTPAFMAPEALTENSNQFYSGRAQDIWSLGITLYALVFGNVPWYEKYVIALYKRIKSEPVVFAEDVLISDLLKGLILGMLQKDPGLRLDIAQIKVHPWTTRNGKVLMPTEEENCTLVTVTQEEVNQAVRVVPHLGTLILVKAMGRKKHFGNPFRGEITQHALRNRRKSSSPVRSNSREKLVTSSSTTGAATSTSSIALDTDSKRDDDKMGIVTTNRLQKLRLTEDSSKTSTFGQKTTTTLEQNGSTDKE